MKPSKWFMSIFVTLVLVLGPNVTGYAFPVSERTPQVRNAIVAAVPDVSSADEVSWDGKNKFGEKVASGVYFYTLTAGDFSGMRKMLGRK